jgi:stage III sporulation protein AG
VENKTDAPGGWLWRIAASDRRAKTVVALGLAGMALILISSIWPSGSRAVQSGITAQQYAQETEQRITTLLSKVQGVGKVHVMVTLENSVQYVYAKDEKQSASSVTTYADDRPTKSEEKGDTQQNYILVDGTGGKAPLILTEMEPAIKGVVVVCEGAKSPVTQQRVIGAVTTALGIRSIQVCVIESAY